MKPNPTYYIPMDGQLQDEPSWWNERGLPVYYCSLREAREAIIEDIRDAVDEYEHQLRSGTDADEIDYAYERIFEMVSQFVEEFTCKGNTFTCVNNPDLKITKRK